MKANFAIMGLLTLTLAGCATGIKRGHVVMKTSANEAHVAMGAHGFRKDVV